MTSSETRNCSKERLTLYAYGELPSEEMRDQEQHLSQCPHCQRELESLQEFIRIKPAFSQLSNAEKLNFAARVNDSVARKKGAVWSYGAVGSMVAAALVLFVVAMPDQGQLPRQEKNLLSQVEILENLEILEDLDLLEDLELLEDLG